MARTEQVTACIFLGFLFACGCSVGPRYQRPAAPAPPAFKEAPPPGWKEAQPQEGILRGKWWEVYQDAQLNTLEEQVSISNQNVLAAEAQFRQARAAVQVSRAALFPVVGASASVTGSRTPGTMGQGRPDIRGIYSLPIDLSYQADLWGSIHRSVAANSAIAQATAAQLENARLFYQAELAADYFQLRGIEGNRELLAATVKSYEEYLQLTQSRYRNGVASLGDVSQAQTQLETARAQLKDLESQRAQFEHALAILTGQPPAQLSLTVAPIQAAPPVIPTGIPSSLLERRPDIAALERQVAAANEQIGIAQAAFYPNLTIGAAAGVESTSFLNWFTFPARVWSVGPQLAQTLFEGGRRRAVLAETQAAYDATVANYRQTVLTAFQQVEDNLATLRTLAEESEIQSRAVQSAEQSLKISTSQYRGGVVSYLQVITNQTIALQNQRTALDLLTRRMVASVLLVQALGGGWDASQLPKI